MNQYQYDGFVAATTNSKYHGPEPATSPEAAAAYRLGYENGLRRLREEREEADRLKYPPRDNSGIASRVVAARAAHRGNDPRAGIRAYCAGNRWLEENAKAVGNW